MNLQLNNDEIQIEVDECGDAVSSGIPISLAVVGDPAHVVDIIDIQGSNEHVNKGIYIDLTDSSSEWGINSDWIEVLLIKKSIGL